MRTRNKRPLPSLNALQAFEATARHLSFTLAARELNVTQGAVSRQVKQLEEQLEVILFHRLHRALALTDQGRLLLQPLTRAFEMMQLGVDRLRNQQQDLSLKVHPTFAIRWLIPRIHRFQALFPKIQVRLTTSSVNVQFSRENFDAGITHLGEESPGVIRKGILEERLIPVCSPSLLRDGNRLNKPEDLKNFVLLHNNPNLKEWQIWAEQTGVKDLVLERGQVFEVDDAALQAATAGLGVALGDLFLIRDELDAGRLVAPLGYLPLKTGFYYFSRPDVSRETPGVEVFQEWLIKELDKDLSARQK
ncbi:MAG: transcriptional regulator GcvA [Myxococcota bacterium]|nr:transcriptional regulator GcvA [Myxococcota bacterium]